MECVLVAATCLFAGCEKNRAHAYHYAVPQATNDGWETASLGSVNIDTNLIRKLFDRINDGSYKNIHSILIIKDGKLVVEEYYTGTNSAGEYKAYDRDRRHELHSVTKSVNAILVGIAIDQHLIAGVEEPISSLLPLYADVFADHQKDGIALKHLLTMSAGLSWDEWSHPYDDARNPAAGMYRSADPVRYFLERTAVAKPGTQFNYSGGICLTLAEIVRQLSGMRPEQFAQRHLFGPLGITNYGWWKFTNGMVDAGGGLSLRPRDMAKIGALYLNAGRWQGKQIVSETWIKQSTANHVNAGQFPKWIQADGYGYQWWVRSFQVGGRAIPSYHAAGRGGQFIFIFPEQEMIAVFTGWNDNELAVQPFAMVQQYILPAVMR